MRHFLHLADLDRQEITNLIHEGLRRKAAWRAGELCADLTGKTLALLFAMPSTRTRLSFEAGIGQLAGNAMYIDVATTQFGRGEPVADTARVFGSMCDGVIIRAHDHAMVTEFAHHCAVPVINALTSAEHPCQILADLMTYQELRGDIAGKKVAWVGDVNNVSISWMHAAALCGFELACAVPATRLDRLPDSARTLAGVSIGHDPKLAVAGSSCVVTDVWSSMSDSTDPKLFQGFTVDAQLLAQAHVDAVFMHCLPAHRGKEVTTEVIDGEQSVVWTEAENRLHVQKSLLVHLLGKGKTCKDK